MLSLRGDGYTFAMSHIEHHKPGSFCWNELSTTDQNAAKEFYSSLFGWAVKDEPMGPGDFYTSFHIGGQEVGAACTLNPDLRAAGVPPNWKLYIAVESADAVTERAAKAGGKLLAPAFDVMDIGRMAVIQDPTGAVFSVWQARKNTGFQLTGEPGTHCWADLNTPDPTRARQFYTDVFGWSFVEDTSTGYLRIQNGTDFIGGVPPVRPENPRIPAHWLSYILVADCDATAAKAKKLGAGICLEPTIMEKIGRVAILDDPQGAAFALYQAWPVKA
jgi:predicted enzyme related to lactoylglutathione lyase